jgi:sugar-specific transcriptional regulator TrmB
MVFDKTFIDKLSLFGLNSYESKLWAAMLSRGIATAGELSEIANVPRSRCYDVLESLEKKGFIVAKIGKPLKYIAVSPAEVLDRVKKGVVERADAEQQKIDSLKDTDIMHELVHLHAVGIDKVVPEDLSALLKGRKNIYNHLSSVFKDAKKSIYIMTTENGLARKHEKFIKDFKEANERNVKIKIAAPITKNTSRIANDLSKYAEVKNTDANSRFILVDGKHLVFMMADDEQANPSYDIGVWVKSPFFAGSMNNMFDMSWGLMKKP